MPNRTAITLVEVAVILVCIFVLLGLLLPAMDTGNGRATLRAYCQNNLRSLGQAVIIFETSRHNYPGYLQSTGTFVANEMPCDPAISDNQTSSLQSHTKLATWAVMLLPYIDQQAVWERWSENRYPIAFSGSPNHPTTSGVAGDEYCSFAAPNIGTFQCPQDRSDQPNGGSNSYVANTGMHHASSNGHVSFAESLSATNGIFTNKFLGLDANGNRVAIGPDVSSRDVKDGLSSTLLLSENVHALPWHRAGFSDASDLRLPTDGSEIRYPPAARFAQGIVWHYEDDSRIAGAAKVSAVHRINGGLLNAATVNAKMSPSNCADLARPSSHHPDDLVQAVFADGSTRTLTPSIDYRVYQAILTPNGSQSHVPDPSFLLTDQLAE